MNKKPFAIFIMLCVILFAGLSLTSGCAKPHIQAGMDGHDREQATYDQNFNVQHLMLRKAQFDVAYTKMLDTSSKQALTDYATDRDKGEFLAIQNEKTKALGYVTVDTVLYSEQGNLYLLTKMFAEHGKKTIKSVEQIQKDSQSPVVETNQPAPEAAK